MTSAGPRVLILGLDGADWTLLDRLFDDGAMPTLQSFVRAGARATLESVRPTNSMSAWTSFLTGVNPGKHGVFDFVRKTGQPFHTALTDSSLIRSPTMFELLSEHGQRACVLDMPPLYPPFPINGIMIGGIGAVAPFQTHAAPKDAFTRVEQAVGTFLPDVAWVGKAGQQDQLLADLIAHVANRERVTEFLLAEQSWDLFCAVFVAPDRMQHVFWQDLTDGGPRYADARRFYQRLDDALARLLDRIDTTATDVFIVSDHGFRRFENTFDVNQVLARRGLLRIHEDVPWRARALRAAGRLVPPLAGRIEQELQRPSLRPLRRLLPESLAYSDIADGVTINLAGREATGSVPPEQFRDVRERVASALLDFHDPHTGTPVIRSLTPGEDYFHGPHANEGPDLLVDCHDGYGHNNALGRVMFRWTYCQGVHSPNGIIAALGPHTRRGVQVDALSIMDVAPTVLALLGLAPPPECDGRVAEELLSALPGHDGQASAPAQRAERPTYTEEEEALVRERLRGLGYIE